ncbi:MAG TPA: hypothetical protein VHC47_08335 [Mucilaginibacter sp.]|nr:hypothetical protein [Mucilaginibacter sp.]
MSDYIVIPKAITNVPCRFCGAQPVIAHTGGGEYSVKCPNDDTHYHTEPGLIDIEDWNNHNTVLSRQQADLVPDTISDDFFQLNGAILHLATSGQEV